MSPRLGGVLGFVGRRSRNQKRIATGKDKIQGNDSVRLSFVRSTLVKIHPFPREIPAARRRAANFAPGGYAETTFQMIRRFC